ncbi:MAG: ribonuclease-3 [Verrucomicrobiales bacterium]|jgi:ribonuclease-3
MDSIEQKIGYKFRNSLLLAEALTHPSLAYETQRPHFDNQRLEYLGDAVLQLILTEHLYTLFPQFTEGQLTKLRSRLVSKPALEAFATRIGLGEFLLMGKGEEASGGRNRASTLADAFESIVGAVYLDGNLEAAKDIILRHCRIEIDQIHEAPNEVNPKGQLQEILQSIAPTSPLYEVISEKGPDHCKEFSSRVVWEDIELGIGSGNSKKEAEIEAARKALESQLWEQFTTSQEDVNTSE